MSNEGTLTRDGRWAADRPGACVLILGRKAERLHTLGEWYWFPIFWGPAFYVVFFGTIYLTAWMNSDAGQTLGIFFLLLVAIAITPWLIRSRAQREFLNEQLRYLRRSFDLPQDELLDLFARVGPEIEGPTRRLVEAERRFKKGEQVIPLSMLPFSTDPTGAFEVLLDDSDEHDSDCSGIPWDAYATESTRTRWEPSYSFHFINHSHGGPGEDPNDVY
ncbi:MAG: hypothetical protein GY722_20245 [bacterium]|nr:hypothetical protein [bacterium]